MVLLDLNKAFDTVWHNGLLFKLHYNKFPDHILKIIDSFLNDRIFLVKINKKHSWTKSIQAGVPQGSVLGTILFNLYINDVPTNPKTQLAIFADDTAIFTSSWSSTYLKKYLQDHLITLHEFFLKWKLKINPTKTEAILFHRRLSYKFNHSPPIQIASVDIPWKKEVKYLGVILDRAVRWKPGIDDRRKKAYIPYKKLYPFLTRNSDTALTCDS